MGAGVESIDKLQQLAKPITKLVLENLNFFNLGGEVGLYNSLIIGTYMTGAELEQLIYEFKLGNKWVVDEFIEWCKKIKDVIVFKIKVIKVISDD
jgi:hypothetical protein